MKWIPVIEADLMRAKASEAFGQTEAPVQAAVEAKDYARAAKLQAELAQAIEKYEVAESGKPGAATAGALLSASWYHLFAKQFKAALESSERAMRFQPDLPVYATNHAHALMFLGREEDARALYRKYKGQRTMEGRGLWEEEILNDFNELEKAKLKDPLMNEIRAEFAAAQKAQ